MNGSCDDNAANNRKTNARWRSEPEKMQEPELAALTAGVTFVEW